MGIPRSLGPVLGISPGLEANRSAQNTGNVLPEISGWTRPDAQGPAEIGIRGMAGFGAISGLDLGEAQVPRTVRELIDGPVRRTVGRGELVGVDQDATRLELNPFTPQRLDDSSTAGNRPQRRDGQFGAPEFSPHASHSVGSREGLGPTAGASSLAPSLGLGLPASTPATRPPPKSSVIEFPSRKF
jgi:hypothetical protein